MPKSSKSRRWWTVTCTQIKRARCRCCREWMESGDLVWSPYYHGGHYHLACMAIPTQAPPPFPGEEYRCSTCQWLVRKPEFDQCRRCYQLTLAEVVV